MYTKNELLPDVTVVDLSSQTHRLWDYRQKTHLLILCGEGAARADAELSAKRRLMDWLGVKVISCGNSAAGLPTGAHAIDRYGRFLGSFEFSPELADQVEKEFLYYEARHC